MIICPYTWIGRKETIKFNFQQLINMKHAYQMFAHVIKFQYSSRCDTINHNLIFINDIEYNKFIIFSDTLSVLKSLKNTDHLIL